VSHESVVVAVPSGVSRSDAGGSRGTGARVLLLAGRCEARWLALNPLVLMGLVVSAWLIWLNYRVLDLPVSSYGIPQPVFWWSADVGIAFCLLPMAGGVLIASQLAASRARRDAMEQLYASYPSPAAVRSGAQLLAVTGPVVLAAVLTAAAVAWVASLNALGAPRWWVLGAGLLLVVLAGPVGVALGNWIRNPLSGIIAVLALVLIEVDLALTYSSPIHLSGGAEWLFPWAAPRGLLNSLPGLIVPYPPLVHVAELAGLIAIAAAAALWPVLARRRAVAAVAAGAVAVTCWSGWLETRPLSASVLSTMAREVTQPAHSEPCRLTQGVRYCYYPAFQPLVRQWAAAVSGVLDRLPAAPRPALVVRQVWDQSFFIPPLLSSGGLTSNGGGVPTRLSTAVADFLAALSTDPGLVAASSSPPVYTDANWGAGNSLGAAQFALAVSVAEWATGLPTTGRSVSYNYAAPGGATASGSAVLACVPAAQARQSIALWLAASATSLTRSAFYLAGSAASTQVGKQWVRTLAFSGSGPSVGLTATAQGAALTAEMLSLPARRVEAVLGARWQYWLSPWTSTAELARALGLPLPRQPIARPDLPYMRGNVAYGNYTPPTGVCR
jgi:hypothetical protein